MTRIEAVMTLMQAARSDRTSNPEAGRIKRACDALGFDDEERVKMFGWLDYCQPDGTPFRTDIKRIW
jgi:hypothetical protein